MKKIKRLKQIISLAVMFSLIVSIMPVMSLSVAACAEDGTEVSPSNQMLHFVMKVRWGNVIGEPTNISKTNFDGSVSASKSARVSLERTLLFEKHNETADKITSEEEDSISWNSLIYNHWDGVKVLVSSPANDKVAISIPEQQESEQESIISMTAQELYDMREPYVKKIGDTGKEIVVKVYPIKDPKYFLKVIWGKTSRADYALKGEADEIESSATATGNAIKNKFGKSISVHNASGSFQINSGGTLKLIKTLRFEGADKITSSSDSKIEWISYVAQGVDGILTKLNLDANSLDKTDTVTLNFTEVENSDGTKGWSKDFSIIDLYHDRITTVTVEGDYGVILQVWRKPNRSLIRVKNKPTVYTVEDGIKQPIPSIEVLSSQGLSFDEVEVIEQDEADTYADGDAVCYADGSIVREKGKPEVYVIADGEKKHIQDPKAFEDLGYDWNSIVKVKPGVLGLYRIRTALKSNSIHPEGALIREVGNPTVYLIEGGKKKPISSLNIFNARRLDWNKVLVVAKNQMEKFEIGANLQYPDGALVRDPVGKVYKMDQGKKLWVRSGDDFTGAGYSAEKIIDVVDTTEINNLAATEEGNDIVADDIK